MWWLSALGLMAGGYLVGAIPFGLLVGLARGVDIRTKGSGNIGATNVGRVLGRPWGFLVFGLDLLKGLAPTILAGTFTHRWSAAGASPVCVYGAWLGVALACILGHMFPIYLGFKGGKGVATSVGVLLGVYPYFTIPAVLTFAAWVVLTLATRYVSVGSMGAAIAFPILFAVFAWRHSETWGRVADLWPFHAFAALVALLVVYRHRGNVRRLLAGTESRIGRPKSPGSSTPTAGV